MVVVFGILMALAFISGLVGSGKKREKQQDTVSDDLRVIRNVAIGSALGRVGARSSGDTQAHGK